jgi:hypothetical protein
MIVGNKLKSMCKKWPWLILRYCSSNFLEGLKETVRIKALDLKLGPTKYKAGMLIPTMMFTVHILTLTCSQIFGTDIPDEGE